MIEELKRQIFLNRSELYMWVPPSRPYYNLEGVYKDSMDAGKLLKAKISDITKKGSFTQISVGIYLVDL